MIFLTMVRSMWERTLTVGSGGKTFSVTGWKVGWIFGAKFLIDALWKAHQAVCFCIVTPLQVRFLARCIF